MPGAERIINLANQTDSYTFNISEASVSLMLVRRNCFFILNCYPFPFDIQDVLLRTKYGLQISVRPAG